MVCLCFRSLYWKHCKGLTHDKCSLVTRNRKEAGQEGMCPTGTLARSVVLEMLTYSSFGPLPTCPALGRAWQESSWLTLGGRGSPGLELEIRGETAQGEQLYRKEIYLFI